jgi:phospholipase C
VILLHYLLDRSLVCAVIAGGLRLRCGRRNRLSGDRYRGYGPRLSLVVVSPFARENYLDSEVLDQSSITRFIEDNWGLGRIGDGSFDAIAGYLSHIFDFSREHYKLVFLNTMTGQVLDVSER